MGDDGRRWKAALAAALLAVSVGCGRAAGPGAGEGSPPGEPSTPTGEPSFPPRDLNRNPVPDGRYAARLCGVDVERRTVDLDLVAWLTGGTAREVWAAEHPDDPQGPPNDYLIVNDDPTLWRQPVRLDVEVRLVRLQEDGDADLDPGTFAELAGYLAASSDEGGCTFPPYRLTFRDGVVIEIEEQYVP